MSVSYHLVHLLYYSLLSDPVDALNIDWAALVENTQPKAAPQPTSALHRYTPAALFSRLGVSHAFAGDALVKKITEKCQEQYNAEAEEEKKQEGNGLVVNVVLEGFFADSELLSPALFEKWKVGIKSGFICNIMFLFG